MVLIPKQQPQQTPQRPLHLPQIDPPNLPPNPILPTQQQLSCNLLSPQKFESDPPSQKSDTTCLNIIYFLLFLYTIFFLYDLVNSIQIQKDHLQRQKQTCIQQYELNECDIPVDAVLQKCLEWNRCRSMDVGTQLKITAVVVRLVGHLISLFWESAKFVGVVGFVLIVVVMLIFVHNNSQVQILETQHKEQ